MKPVRKPSSMTRNVRSSLEIFRRVEKFGAYYSGAVRYKEVGEGGPYRVLPPAKEKDEIDFKG